MASDFHSHLGLVKGQKFGDKYQLEKYLKRGGEAEIWKAIDTTTQEIVAIRILRDHEHTRDARRHFTAEVQKLQQLARHPHIVPLLDSGWDNGLPYLVMPYIPDGSLAALLTDLRRGGQQLPFKDAILYIQQTLDALIYVHKHDIIHRDVKPANLLRGEHGILLNDWGIALDAAITYPLTRAHSGSLPYVSPEQLQGHPVLASDQYALAVTGCEIITGQYPKNGGYEQLQKLHPQIAKVFRRAWDLDSTKRFESMQAFANAFDKAVHSELDPYQTQSEPNPISRLFTWHTWRTWQKSLAVGAIVLILSGSFLAAFPLLRSTPPTTLCLETDLPEHGAGQLTAQAITNGVRLALAQKTNPFLISYKGFHLAQNDLDDSSSLQSEQADATAGVQNIQNLFQHSQTACPNPIAIIGPGDTTVAIAEIPVAAMHQILLLSPATTAPCLTQENYPIPGCTHQTKFANTFGRLPGTDLQAGSIIAQFLLNQLHPHNIVIVDDGGVSSDQIAQAVIDQLENTSIMLLEIDCIANSPNTCSLNEKYNTLSIGNIAELAIQKKKEQPGAIFFAGFPKNGASLLRQDLGNEFPFIGADPLVNEKSAFFNTLGSDGANTYAIFPAPDPSTFPSGTSAEATFDSQYKSMFHGSPPLPYSTNGYDAANIIIQTIKHMLDTGQAITPATVAQAVLNNDSGRNDFIGIAGNKIQFNQNGDNVQPQPYTIYQSTQQPQGSWDWHPTFTCDATTLHCFPITGVLP